MRQVLINLLDNAIDHGKGEITLRACAAADGVEISVSDQGGGFPRDFAERAFDRFSRADSTRGESGAGLGLALAGNRCCPRRSCLDQLQGLDCCPSLAAATSFWPHLGFLGSRSSCERRRGCAPTGKRVDLQRPTFSNPTAITNPLFPVSQVRSVIQVGKVDGKPFRSETTTLPTTALVDWYGVKIPVVLSQYTAYLDGTITEVAIDRYAQADDGSVWYFGEDVIDYVGGAAAFTEGTWLAGRDGPPAMIMPAKPKPGDVFRVENVIGIVFEELTVVKVDQTVQGPNGPVPGAIVVDELGVSGGHSLKTLAPGYGEFQTADGPDLEAMAVAMPIDGQPGGPPAVRRRDPEGPDGCLGHAGVCAGQGLAARSGICRAHRRTGRRAGSGSATASCDGPAAQITEIAAGCGSGSHSAPGRAGLCRHRTISYRS